MENQRLYLNPNIEVVRDEGDDGWELTLENPGRNETYRLASPRLLTLLDAAAPSIDREELVATVAAAAESDDEPQTVIDQLIGHGVLLESEPERPLQSWREHGWNEAADYYTTIRDYPFVDYSEGKEALETDYGRMEQYQVEESIPPRYKNYDDEPTVELPSPEEASLPDLRDVIGYQDLGRERNLTAERLSTILYYTFGEIGRLEFPSQGEFLIKTSPSGGARHPTEAYVVAFDVADLDPGIYHYSVRDHALSAIAGAIEPETLSETVYGLQERSDAPKAVLFFTSVLERSMWRYREPRTYSVVQNDIGHLMETLRLLSNGLGIPLSFGHGFEDSDLAALLGVDLLAEPPFRFAALGRNPPE
jgi:SagB-type dehydrogenase family enzyme